MAKKLGFALGAGGSRGIAHIGFIKAMEEEGIKADFVTGTSMGSVVGSVYCAGYSADYMHEEVKKLSPSDLFDLSFNPWTNGALLRAQKMRKKIESYFLDFPTFNELKTPFKCVAVDLLSANTKVFSGDENIAEGVCASCSIPGVFKPVVKDGMVLVDGAIKCRVPIDEVREMGAEVIVAVDVLGEARPQTKKYNLFSLMLRTYDIVDAELAKEKLKSQKPDMFLTPELGDMDQYKFKNLEFAYNAGYEIGKKNAKKIKKLVGIK